MEYFWCLCVTRDLIGGRGGPESPDGGEAGGGEKSPVKLSSVPVTPHNTLILGLIRSSCLHWTFKSRHERHERQSMVSVIAPAWPERSALFELRVRRRRDSLPGMDIGARQGTASISRDTV